MNDLDVMQLLLCILLLVSGLLRLIRQTCCRTRTGIASTTLVVTVGYTLFSVALCLIIAHFVSRQLLLPTLLLLLCTATAAAALAGIRQLRSKTEIFTAVLIGVWLAALAAVTLVLREVSETSVLLHFDAFSRVSRFSSLEPLVDILMNIVLFLPLGYLLPIADHEHFVWLNVLSTALLLTASVEALQLLFSLGQADVEDLATNVLGAIIGLFLHYFLPYKS